MRILLRKVRWANLLSTGNYFLEVDLSNVQKTLLIGSNAAGKSTFLDAITYALYGRPFRKINKPDLVNFITGKNLLVELEFQIGTNSYLVRRGQKPEVFEIFENGNLLLQDAASRDYQRHLEQHILKMNLKSFCQVVLLGKANITPFLQLTPAERRVIVEDLLDIQIFSTMNNLLKKEIASNEKAISDIEHSLAVLQTKQSMTEENIDALRSSYEEMIKEKQEKIASYHKEILRNKKELLEYQEALEGNEPKVDRIRKLEKTKGTIEKTLKDCKTKISRIEKEADFYRHNDNCPTCRQVITEIFKTEVLEQKNEDIKKIENGSVELKSKYEQLSHKIEDLKEAPKLKDVLTSKIADLNISNRSTERFISSLEREIAALEQKIVNLSADRNEDFKSQIEEVEQSKISLTQMQKVQGHAATLLKDGGIKAKIIKKYIAAINKLVNKYLIAFELPIELTLDEEFNDTILSRNRDKTGYMNLSEGEKLRVDLSILFAWRSLAQMRNSSSINLLVMDEIFDSSLDSSGIDNFLKILSTFKDNNIFVISHKGDILLDKFDRVIKMSKVKHFSQMEIAA